MSCKFPKEVFSAYLFIFALVINRSLCLVTMFTLLNENITQIQTINAKFSLNNCLITVIGFCVLIIYDLLLCDLRPTPWLRSTKHYSIHPLSLKCPRIQWALDRLLPLLFATTFSTIVMTGNLLSVLLPLVSGHFIPQWYRVLLS